MEVFYEVFRYILVFLGLLSITFSDGANHTGEKRSISAQMYESFRDKMGANSYEVKE